MADFHIGWQGRAMPCPYNIHPFNRQCRLSHPKTWTGSTFFLAFLLGLLRHFPQIGLLFAMDKRPLGGALAIQVLAGFIKGGGAAWCWMFCHYGRCSSSFSS
jgi:hypothetical protein